MAIIVCPECGKEISDQHEYCIYCGYPINPKEKIKESGIKVEAHDVMILGYSSKKQEAKDNLMKLCNATPVQANEVVSKLPCYIYEDISIEYAEKISEKLINAKFKVAIFNETGKVKYLTNNEFASEPLPSLVAAPRKKRIVTFENAIFNPRPIVMPLKTPKYNEGFKSLAKKKTTTKKIVKKKVNNKKK